MEDLGKSIRMEHLANSGAEERARREREQRRKEQLRLEYKRRFEDDSDKTKDLIPMAKMEVTGLKGRETVNLVDIRMIQSKCLFLDDGTHGVKDMLRTQRRQEQQRKRTPLTKSMQ